eukprot:3515924-Amphidinium_carterae.4
MITPGLAHTPPGVLSTGMELDPEQGLFLWNMILGGMPMAGLVWTTLIGKELLQDVIHPDALNVYTHPEGRPHSIMFPIIYLLKNFLMMEGREGEVWQPRYKDGSGELDDSAELLVPICWSDITSVCRVLRGVCNPDEEDAVYVEEWGV